MKKIVFSLLAAAFILASCGGGTQAAKEVLKSRAPTAAEIGKEAVCPVMGTKFIVSKDTPTFDYKGKAYFMCCGDCPGPFSENPEKYVK
jgi:YHS domain-containing protein